MKTKNNFTAERYVKNYTIAAIILSVLLSVMFIAGETCDTPEYCLFWGFFCGFLGVFSVWCDKYVNGKSDGKRENNTPEKHSRTNF